jgi:cytochrome d ubiquinol oxidase subunit II
MIVALWYGIAAFMISTYVVLDGRNFGAGIASFVVARQPSERRQIVAAIGPLWLWHEVWLIGFGGVLLVAFPRLLASAFAGYYLAMFLILWCLVLRGIAIEVGGHLDDRLWQSFWDAVFFLSSALLAVLFGAALGNVIRGVPLRPGSTFHMAFFSDFRTRGHVGLLDWYTTLVAAFGVLALTAHGATYLAWKTEGPLHDRAALLARRLWLCATPAFLGLSAATWLVRRELFTGLARRPLAYVGTAVCAVCAAALARALLRRNERRAFLASTFLLQAVLATGAAALYPVMLFSTLDPADRLTASDAASPHEGLVIAAVWWPVAALLAFAYSFFIARYYGGKVGPTRDGHGTY